MKLKQLSKAENIIIVIVQIWIVIFCLLVIGLKLDRWCFEGYFETQCLHIFSNVDYKFPLLDSYWETCKYTDFIFAFFIIDWLSYVGVLAGGLTSNFIITGVSSGISLLCCGFSLCQLLNSFWFRGFRYLGFDPILDLMIFAFGHVATIIFMSIKVENIYDIFYGNDLD
jgi:hypothetical protein